MVSESTDQLTSYVAFEIIYVLLVAKVIFISLQNIHTTLNSLFIQIFGLPEISTRSSAINNAVTILSPIFTPNLVLCSAVPRDEIYRANNMGG